LPDDYNGNPDVDRYKKLLVRSLFVLIAPFGFSKDDIIEKAGYERQSRLTEFVDKPYKEVSREELIVFFNNLKPLPVVLHTPTHTFTYDVKEYSPQTVMRYKTNVKTFFPLAF